MYTYLALNNTCIMLYMYIACCTYLLPPDASLTPHTLLHAVSTVRRFWGLVGEVELLDCLDVPYSVREQIRGSQSYSSEDEKRTAVLQYYIETLPGASWGRIAGALWYMEERTALETVRQYLPHKPGEYTCTYRVVVQGRIQHVIITGGCTVILAHAQVVGGGAVRTLVQTLQRELLGRCLPCGGALNLHNHLG